MKTVLSTKTLDSDVLAYAQVQNLDVKCLDFIETKGLPFDIAGINPENFDAVAFTSPNAVKYFFGSDKATMLLNGKQIFGLQGKTKNDLLSHGVSVNTLASSAAELATEIIKAKTVNSLLHVCGTQKLTVLQEKLEAAGITYVELPIYQTILNSNQKVNEPFNAILFFSPSGVESFLTENNFADETVCCCIGTTTAQALSEKRNGATIILPAEPTPLAMLKTTAQYLNN